MKAGDISQQESKNIAHTNRKVTTDKFSSEKTATESQQRQTIIANSSIYNQERHHSSREVVFKSRDYSTSSSVSENKVCVSIYYN